MTLDEAEFIRRFANAYFTERFYEIPHYGILSSTYKAACAAVIKEQLTRIQSKAKAEKEIYNPFQCPCCKKETMQTILRFNRRGPPADWEDMARKLLEYLV